VTRIAMRGHVARFRKAGLSGLFLWLMAVIGFVPNFATAQQPPLQLQIESATAAFDQRTREPVVTFRLTEQSGRLFAEFTGSNIGRTVEIRVVMRPIIREPIAGGSVQVSGGFTRSEAKDLADRLNNGTAKVEAEVVEN
jgi:preprotein translocase subunit SecD